MGNIAILTGHIGADFTLNKTNTNGKSVCNFSLATNRKYTDSQGNKVEKTDWHKIVCWGKLAEIVAQYMHKGSQVEVIGRIETNRPYPGNVHYAANGQVIVDANGAPVQGIRYATEIVAREVEFLDKKDESAVYTQPVAAVAAVAAVAPASTVAPVAAPVATFVAAPAAPVVAADPNVVAGTFVPPVVVGPGV